MLGGTRGRVRACRRAWFGVLQRPQRDVDARPGAFRGSGDPLIGREAPAAAVGVGPWCWPLWRVRALEEPAAAQARALALLFIPCANSFKIAHLCTSCPEV